MLSVKFEKQLFLPERLHRSHILNALGRNLNNAWPNLDINVLKINTKKYTIIPFLLGPSARRLVSGFFSKSSFARTRPQLEWALQPAAVERVSNHLPKQLSVLILA